MNTKKDGECLAMDDRLPYFIAVIEEGSISRAAERLFLSQQCISNYIKQLESEFGCAFFMRKPVFAPTAAGEAYYRYAKKAMRVELEMKEEMKDAISGQTGSITVGIHLSRAGMVLSEILPAFWKKCPRVGVEVRNGITLQMEKELADGTVDVVFAINPSHNAETNVIVLNEERMFLSISDSLLRVSFPESYPDCISRFEAGVDLKEFEHIPFIRRQAPNNTLSMIDAFLFRKKICLNNYAEINSSELRNALCAEGFAATITNEPRAKQIKKYRDKQDEPVLVHCFPILEMEPMKHCLLTRRFENRSRFVSVFCETAKECADMLNFGG